MGAGQASYNLRTCCCGGAAVVGEVSRSQAFSSEDPFMLLIIEALKGLCLCALHS